jgi:DNA (cytosine-5)-methyltransferase 1
VRQYRVVEICAGAGGQSLGLEVAGFEHELAVELDPNAASTLRHNRPQWKVAEGDVASSSVWDPSQYEGIDLFAWAIELCGTVKPRVLMLENVRGLSLPRFSAYRQHVLDRLAQLGYAADWRLLHASDYGVPQLRPRFVLVAMRPADFGYFSWPEPRPELAKSVGETLRDLMAEGGWPGADRWAQRASDIAPTIVGGSKKHGGADLGPTRAKRAWREMGVDALGVADAAPAASDPVSLLPKLTTAMVARIQGWDDNEYRWTFTGRKTTTYRQIGNAFPPPVARALGDQVRRALNREGMPRDLVEQSDSAHDLVYAVLRDDGGFLTMEQILRRLPQSMDVPAFERHLAHLRQDFHIDTDPRKAGDAYRLGDFKAFIGQDDHLRHEAFIKPTRIS